ncbi:MAG: hypothetical protein ACOYZ8_16415 [Chloroflexota bacterium]
MLFLTNPLLDILGAPPAYLDPGSGSFLIQLLLAAALGIGVAVRASWGKIKGWFGIKPREEGTDADDADEK